MLLGLGVCAGSAQAQTYDFNVGPSFVLGQPVGGASGSFHVVISNVGGTSYSVSVTGNADGNPASGPEGSANPVGNPIPKSGIGIVSLNFNQSGGGLIDSTSASGSTNMYVGAPGGNLGGPNNMAFGSTGGTWGTLAGATTVSFAGAGGFPFYIAPHGGNTFSGLLTLQPGVIGSIHVALQDSGQQYAGDFAVTPEASSLALLLPGLIPVGIALRRRRMSSKA